MTNTDTINAESAVQIRLIELIRAEFQKLISQKTGWGKNEIMQNFDVAIAVASLRLLGEMES